MPFLHEALQLEINLVSHLHHPMPIKTNYS